MKTKNLLLASSLVISASLALSFFAYPYLPSEIASHWSANGEVNGTMGKFWESAFMPILMFFLAVLLLWIPTIDPKKENVASFRKYYDGTIIGILVFLLYVHTITLAWNLGYRFDMTKAVVLPISLLWYLLGVILPKIKQNWFMGIRTPWTLENEKVWNDTHIFAGKLFRYSALVSLLGFLFPSYLFFFVLIPIIFSALASVVYSYYSFKKI